MADELQEWAAELATEQFDEVAGQFSVAPDEQTRNRLIEMRAERIVADAADRVVESYLDQVELAVEDADNAADSLVMGVPEEVGDEASDLAWSAASDIRCAIADMELWIRDRKRKQIRARWRGRKICDVIGDAAKCGPCALSAVTGLPSETWQDEDMTQDEMMEALYVAGYHFEFTKPTKPTNLSDLDVSGPSVVSVGNYNNLLQGHFVAVGMQGRRGSIADNCFRKATGFKRVATGKYRDYTIGGVIRVWRVSVE